MVRYNFRSPRNAFDVAYVLVWLQSGELIRGRENLAGVNSRYLSAWRWVSCQLSSAFDTVRT